MIKIVVLNGNPTAGKNTFAEFVEQFYPVIDHISYVDFTRNMLDKMRVDYSGKTAKDRQLIESINDALERHSDIPFRDICACISSINKFSNKINKNDRPILFIDIRKPENIWRLRKEFPETVTVFVEDGKPTSDVTFSDSVVRCMDYDYIIDNTGSVDDLKEKARQFVEEITKGGE